MITNDPHTIAEAMRTGGHFMANLAEALTRADSRNTAKILTTWKDEINELLARHLTAYVADVTVSVYAANADEADRMINDWMSTLIVNDNLEIESVSEAEPIRRPFDLITKGQE